MGVAQEKPIGVFKWPQYQDLLVSVHEAEIFGVPLYGTFVHADETPNPTNTRILAVILIILMSATSFLTQRQLLLKNTASDNPIAQQMKIMMYIFPVMFAVGGMNFPIGVLIYWFTTNLWTMGQQFWVIRNNPQPGTPAALAAAERKAQKAAKKGLPVAPESGAGTVIPGEVVDETPISRVGASSRRSNPKQADRSTTQVPMSAEHDPMEDHMSNKSDLEREGDVAADYLEALLDIADLDGDIDMDVERDRAMVSIVGGDLDDLVGSDGKVLEALQELTRLAVTRETGERSRLMLDIAGFRAARRAELAQFGERAVADVKRTGEPVKLAPDDRLRAQGRP